MRVHQVGHTFLRPRSRYPRIAKNSPEAAQDSAAWLMMHTKAPLSICLVWLTEWQIQWQIRKSPKRR